MAQGCGSCQWGRKAISGMLIHCEFPVPVWIARELHHPLTGGGYAASLMKITDGTDCPTYAPTEGGEE